MRASRPEGGWVLVIVLIALALVAWLARDALLRLLPAATVQTGTTAKRVAPPGEDANAASPGSAAPVARARAVEATVEQGAARLERDLDAQAR
jgi:hypothetical protein